MDPPAPDPSTPSPRPSTAVQSPDTLREEQPSSPAGNAAVPPAPQPSSPLPGSEHPMAVTAAAEGEHRPKGKRKRTAAKDKAILEAAYNADPKPDKAARLDIVRRVSLNEKEVQIWFQNRRQNDRRKSRPLSPQEIAALRYGGMQILSSDPATYNTSFSSDLSQTSPVQPMSQPEQGPMSPPLLQPHSDQPGSSFDDQEKSLDTRREAQPWADTSVGNDMVTPAPKERTAEESRHTLTRSFSGSVGYISNRWNTSFSTPTFTGEKHDASRSFPSSCPSSFTAGSILPPLDSRASKFRLSMSLEGKAEVVPSVPSPPRPTAGPPTPDALLALGPIRRPNLQRSHSVSSPSITLPPISDLTNSLPPSNTGALPPRLTRGRSRDVHAWEFCCDAENREDPLLIQAKHESTGSAIAAISLLRSTSSTSGSPLQQSSSAKRNAPMGKAAPRQSLAKKPKLGRAASSVARLQSEKPLVGQDTAPVDKLKINTLVSPGGDSDKENWSPDTEGNPRTPLLSASRHNMADNMAATTARRPLPTSKNPRRTPGRPLHDSRGPAFISSRANTAPVSRGGFRSRRDRRAQSPLEIYEDCGSSVATSPAGAPTPAVPSSSAALDDEVERFMRGQVSPSKKGDADAVAGLLSLSQGNWR